MAVQEPLINWLSLPATLALALRGGAELFLAGAFGLLLIRKLIKNESLKGTPIDFLLLGFLIVAAFTTFFNHNDPASSFDNLRAILRFVTLYYLIANLEIDDRQTLLLMRAVLIIGVVEGLLALAQYTSPGINNLFVSRRAAPELGGAVKAYAALKVGAVVGTFGVPAEMALFQCGALIVLAAVAAQKSLKSLFAPPALIALALIAWGAFATYKRFALLMIPFLLFVIIFLRANKPQRLIVTLAGILALSLGAIFFAALPSIYDTLPKSFTKLAVREEAFAVSEFVSELFSPQYWTRVFNASRGWFMFTVTEHMFQSDHLLIGYGPDESLARATLADSNYELRILNQGYKGFEDVYWIAMFIYYGLIGVALFGLMIFQTMRAGFWLYRHGTSDPRRLLGLVAFTFAVLAVFYNFAERAFELRAFSFFFWLFAGLAANKMCVEKLALENLTTG